jgi:hypothetical protein
VQAQRPTAPASQRTIRHEEVGRGPGLTRAQARALRRSEPLTPAQFKELRLLAEHGVSPLRRL